MENCSFNDTGWNGYTILGTETLHHFRGSNKVECEILVDFINKVILPGKVPEVVQRGRWGWQRALGQKRSEDSRREIGPWRTAG